MDVAREASVLELGVTKGTLGKRAAEGSAPKSGPGSPERGKTIPVAKESFQHDRVLIVEDEPLVAILLLDLVEDAGFKAVGQAASARAALHIAEAEHPTVALVDVNLGGVRDGLRVGAELSRRGIAIILVSGHVDVAEWPEVRELAPVAVLTKPCRPSELIHALKAAADPGRHHGSG